MKSFVAAVAAVGLAAMVGMPAPAAAHDAWHRPGPRVGVFFHFWDPFFYYPRPYYYDPPVVVYRYAPPPPRVVYVAPQPAVVYAAPAPVTVSPASPVYTDSLGRTCREYQTTVSVGGAPQPAYGTACLQPDGSWRVVR